MISTENLCFYLRVCFSTSIVMSGAVSEKRMGGFGEQMFKKMTQDIPSIKITQLKGKSHSF